MLISPVHELDSVLLDIAAGAGDDWDDAFAVLSHRNVVATANTMLTHPRLQGDIAACVHEMIKSHKVYVEEEKQAQDTRIKAIAVEQK